MNCNKCGKEIANIQTASCTNFVCKKCGSTEYEIKDKSNGNGIAHGLYCAKCGFWHKWLNKKELVYYKNIKLKDFKSNIDNLLIEFDEMGFAPTTPCPDPEKYAIEWREKVRAEFERLEIENAALRERLDKAVELPLKPSDFHIEPFFAEIKKDLLYENKIKVCVPIYAYFLFENEDKAELFVKGLQGENNEHI